VSGRPEAAAAPGDSILDVEGLRVGHATDAEALTGCTVVLAPEGTSGGVDVRGGACGLREVQTLSPDHLAPHVHAVCLAGGSAYGLGAADGVLAWLEREGIGFQVGAYRVPIVPAAILYDLGLGRGNVRPDAAMGWRACMAARGGPLELPQGNVGAGTGASVGKLCGMGQASKGGLGSASVTGPGDVRVGALAAVNALGDVVDPDSGRPVAGLRAAPEGRTLLETRLRLMRSWGMPWHGGPNTTLAVVATDAVLSKADCARVAAMAQAGLIETVRPCHTRYDGDVIFCLATGGKSGTAAPESLGVLASLALRRAVLRAVLLAEPAGGLPAARELLEPQTYRELLRRHVGRASGQPET
jgi:L-aminopeptidase/D-esterase-like protein